MDLAVAIQATRANEIATGLGRQSKSCLPAGRIRANRRSAGMRSVMAFCTKEWGAGFQERGDIGAVRRVTIRTVFRHRLMFKQEGPTFFRMTGEARFGHRIFLQ